jgi:hypothetical protein
VLLDGAPGGFVLDGLPDAVVVAWPKRAGGVPTDLTEDGVREVALARGPVDGKALVAGREVWRQPAMTKRAVDAVRSGLKLVIRTQNR